MKARLTVVAEIQLNRLVALKSNIGKDEAESLAMSVFRREEKTTLSYRTKPSLVGEGLAIETRASTEKGNGLCTMGFECKGDLVNRANQKGRFIPALTVLSIGVVKAGSLFDAADRSAENASPDHYDRLAERLDPAWVVGIRPIDPTLDGGDPHKVGTALACQSFQCF